MKKINLEKWLYDLGQCERGLNGLKSCQGFLERANYCAEHGDEEGYNSEIRNGTGEMLCHIERLTDWAEILRESVREIRKKRA